MQNATLHRNTFQFPFEQGSQFHINETLPLFDSVLSMKVYKLSLFYSLQFLFWRDRLKMKKNSNNGKDPNDPNINGVEENLTENQS